jgi:hypothetical protein
MGEPKSGVEQVPCEVCLKEIPVSEAKIAEAADYVAYFCGLECYTRWKDQTGKPGVSGPQ